MICGPSGFGKLAAAAVSGTVAKVKRKNSPSHVLGLGTGRWGGRNGNCGVGSWDAGREPYHCHHGAGRRGSGHPLASWKPGEGPEELVLREAFGMCCGEGLKGQGSSVRDAVS